MSLYCEYLLCPYSKKKILSNTERKDRLEKYERQCMETVVDNILNNTPLIKTIFHSQHPMIFKAKRHLRQFIKEHELVKKYLSPLYSLISENTEVSVLLRVENVQSKKLKNKKQATSHTHTIDTFNINIPPAINDKFNLSESINGFNISTNISSYRNIQRSNNGMSKRDINDLMANMTQNNDNIQNLNQQYSHNQDNHNVNEENDNVNEQNDNVNKENDNVNKENDNVNKENDNVNEQNDNVNKQNDNVN